MRGDGVPPATQRLDVATWQTLAFAVMTAGIPVAHTWFDGFHMGLMGLVEVQYEA